jgi:hypothetical protein
LAGRSAGVGPHRRAGSAAVALVKEPRLSGSAVEAEDSSDDGAAIGRMT